MIKFIIPTKRHPSLTREQFVEHDEAVHADLFMSMPVVRTTVRRYVQQHALASDLPGMLPARYDGITELWFDDVGAQGRCLSDAGNLAVIRPDEVSLLDLHGCDFIVSSENTVLQ